MPVASRSDPSLFPTPRQGGAPTVALSSIARWPAGSRQAAAQAESQERPCRPAWRRDPAAPLERLVGRTHRCARRSLPRTPNRRANRPRVARSRTESGPPGEKSWAGERKWGRLYPGGGASRVVGLRGMGSSLVSRRGLGETAPPRHPRRGVAVSDSMQAVLRTSDLSLSVGLRAGVPRSKASFGQRVRTALGRRRLATGLDWLLHSPRSSREGRAQSTPDGRTDGLSV